MGTLRLCLPEVPVSNKEAWTDDLALGIDHSSTRAGLHVFRSIRDELAVYEYASNRRDDRVALVMNEERPTLE